MRLCLQADPTQKTKYQINGTPLHWVLEGVLPDGVIYAVHDRFSHIVVREDMELMVNP
jgi:hypothetical protein